jgi:hypothetical protein
VVQLQSVPNEQGVKMAAPVTVSTKENELAGARCSVSEGLKYATNCLPQ